MTVGKLQKLQGTEGERRVKGRGHTGISISNSETSENTQGHSYDV